jgi:ech hydrogenase subunit D
MLDGEMIVEKEYICDAVSDIKTQGYRFVSMTCEEEDCFELIYHFDLNYKMKNVKVMLKKGETMKSISGIYPSAFLIENEYQDLYGLVFEGLTIDYKGNLYLTPESPKTPMTEKAEA